jgi:hypothetical protein
MSYAIPSYYEDSTAQPLVASPDLIFIPRSRNQWLAFLAPTALCGISWMSGGTPALTDLGFVLFTCICAVYLTVEFLRFPRRFGIGGLVLYGGSLCWFCQDYCTHWLNHDFVNDTRMPAEVIAKAAFLHCWFVMLMSIGLNWNTGKWAVKLLGCLPDPGNRDFYLWVLLALFAFGISPYFIFVSEPWYMALYHAMFAGWTGGAAFTVYRTGNLNYSWGAYVAQIMQVGSVSGIVAIVYTILIAPSLFTRLLGIAIWGFYTLVAFESGRRGEISFTLLPPIAILFIKYQAQAAAFFRSSSLKAFVVCGLLAVGMQFVIQFQGTFRSSGYATADVSQIQLFANQGNTMFSEGLLGYAIVDGDRVPFFNAPDFPGEGFIVAIPHTVFDFVVGIIPRALWNDKPVDSLWEWYNGVYQGTGREGTTISKGLVGSWYFKYGLGGIIEGGLLMGWLMGLSERALQHSDGKPLNILIALAFATWIFRTYRDFIFIDLYGLILGSICLYFLILTLRPLLGGSSNQPG